MKQLLDDLEVLDLEAEICLFLSLNSYETHTHCLQAFLCLYTIMSD